MTCSRAKLFYSYGFITDGTRVCMCVSSVSRFDRLKPHSVHTCATAILYVFPSCHDFGSCRGWRVAAQSRGGRVDSG
jgi:hypothetical protein